MEKINQKTEFELLRILVFILPIFKLLVHESEATNVLSIMFIPLTVLFIGAIIIIKGFIDLIKLLIEQLFLIIKISITESMQILNKLVDKVSINLIIQLFKELFCKNQFS